MINKVEILTCSEWRRGAHRAFVNARMPSGITFNDCSFLLDEHGPWAAPPGKPQIDRDGSVIRDQNGKIKYSAVIEFADRETRTRWSNTIIEALRSVHPEAFEP